MLGGRSIPLARVYGIRIGVDPSWFLVLFLIIWSLSGTYREIFPGEETQAFVLATATALLFFLSVVLHELGHAAVAIRNGIGIAGIDLWLFGGVARMSREADSAGVEFRVAAAGPLVTLGLVGLCLGALAVVAGPGELARGLELQRGSGVAPIEALLGYLAVINAFLLVFNLIPGFPLDGGRMARALVWWRTGDRMRATRFAARLGRAVAYLLVGAGVFAFLRGSLVGGVWLALIGMFIAQAARSAEIQTAVSTRLGGLRVSDVMDREPVAVPAEAKLDRVLEDFFLRYRWPWFPVIDPAGRFLGLVSRAKVDGVPEALRPGWTVDAVMTAEGGSDLRVGLDEPLEALLASEGLRRLGAVVAVDREGVLRGVVTLDRVRRALRPTPPLP